MRVLWITNAIFPAPCKVLGIPEPVIGGWMTSSATNLVNSGDVQLAVATVFSGKNMQKFDIENISYYLLPKNRSYTKYDNTLEKYWRQIKEDFRPDIIHIHGTELAPGLAYIRACGNKGTIVSIQGLISIIARYNHAGISSKVFFRNITFRDIIKQEGFFKGTREISLRGKIEKEYIRTAEHIIGRTFWDRVHTKAINKDVQYSFCNETLRPVFYNEVKWQYENCVKHSIFLSGSDYPFKGLHQVLKAMPFVLQEYPYAKIYVSGNNFISRRNLSDRIRMSGYAKYIISLMKKLKIRDKVIFTGPMSENKMHAQYLQSNVFICPSSIENSSNSVGEAQLLGVPVIASYVGGVADLIKNGESGYLYRFEEVEMMAKLICDVFRMKDCTDVSKNEILVASKRHDKHINTKALIEIYNHINS